MCTKPTGKEVIQSSFYDTFKSNKFVELGFGCSFVQIVMFTGQIALFDATVVSQIIQEDFKTCRISVKNEDVVTRTERTVWTEHEGKYGGRICPHGRLTGFKFDSTNIENNHVFLAILQILQICIYLFVAGVNMTFRA